MAEHLKGGGIDGRWSKCLQNHYPFHDAELGESLLILLAYIGEGAPQLWVGDEHIGSTGRTAAAAKSLSEAQHQFDWQHGELATVLSVYQAWDKTAKNNRPHWCEENQVNGITMSRLQKVLNRFKYENKFRKRRRRSTPQEATSEERNVCDRLALLLLDVFPNCVYVQWRTENKYLNCRTSTCKVLDSSDVELFQQLGTELPQYLFCLPNCTSREGQDLDMLTISLVIPEAVTQIDGKCSWAKKFPELPSLMPVKVTLPDMGDATVLSLAGSPKAKAVFQKVIHNSLEDEDVALSIELHEPGVKGAGWELEVFCPQRYEEEVEGIIDNVVQVSMEDLASDPETRYFPDSDRKLKLFIGAGADTQIVQTGQHLVLVHILTLDCHDEDLEDYLWDTEDIDSQLCADFKECGKICEIEMSEDFPERSLWGAVWYKYRASAWRAMNMAREYDLHPGLRLKVVSVDSEAPHFSLRFHWWQNFVVKNEMELYFVKEEDMNRFKAKEHSFDSLHFEFDANELKLTLTSCDPEPFSWEDMFGEHEKKVCPKAVNYSHEVRCGQTASGLLNLKDGISEKVESYFADPDMLQIAVFVPRPEDSESETLFNRVGNGLFEVPLIESKSEGSIGSYSGTGLFEVKFAFSLPGHGKLHEGEVAFSPGVYMYFTAPKEVFENAPSELRAFLDENQCPEYPDEIGPPVDQDGREEMLTEGVVTKTIVLYEKEKVNFPKLREYTRLLKPHILHVRGEVLAHLLAVSLEDHQPNYLRIMNDTHTFIQIKKDNHALHVYGEIENVSAVKEKVNKLTVDFKSGTTGVPEAKADPRDTKVKNEKADSPCVLAGESLWPNCESQVTGGVFRLCLCGHAYCNACAREMVTESIDRKCFPILCEADNCAMKVLLVDIEAICLYNSISMNDLYIAALASQDTTSNCLTADCPMMYHNYKPDDVGLVKCFTCPLCKVSMCMTCREPYHFGVSCKVHDALKTLNAETRVWLDEDRANRKLCPKCLKGVHKSSLQNYAFCERCRAYSCCDCQVYGDEYMVIFSHHCIAEDND